MSKPFFDRRGGKRRLSGANARLFNEVYWKMVKTECRYIFVALLSIMSKVGKFFKEKYTY